MPFLDLDKVFTKQLADKVSAKIAWGDKIMLSLVTLEHGSKVPLHSHPHEQAGIVVEGEFDFTIGGETRRVREGDMYIIPGGVQHMAEARSGRAVALDIFHPIREEYTK